MRPSNRQADEMRAIRITRNYTKHAEGSVLIEFGDNSVNLQLRFWISDAHNGVQNVKSAILLTIWDKFKEAGIEIPYPQRDLHLRSGFDGLGTGI